MSKCSPEIELDGYKTGPYLGVNPKKTPPNHSGHLAVPRLPQWPSGRTWEPLLEFWLSQRGPFGIWARSKSINLSKNTQILKGKKASIWNGGSG